MIQPKKRDNNTALNRTINIELYFPTKRECTNKNTIFCVSGGKMKCHCLFFILHVNRSAMQRDSLISAINFYCQQ